MVSGTPPGKYQIKYSVLVLSTILRIYSGTLVFNTIRFGTVIQNPFDTIRFDTIRSKKK